MPSINRNDRYVKSWLRGPDYGKKVHRIMAEKALGKPLPSGAVVHHVDGNSKNNSSENLVVCPNEVYHSLLHRRTQALEECGNANYIKCVYCKKWDAPENLYLRANKGATNQAGRHRSCHNEVTLAAYHRKRREQK